MFTDDDLTRRMFLARFGKTSMAVAILGIGAVACSDDATSDSAPGCRPLVTAGAPPAHSHLFLVARR